MSIQSERLLYVKEGVGAIMGGKILDHEAKDILNMGIAKGREEGREQGVR